MEPAGSVVNVKRKKGVLTIIQRIRTTIYTEMRNGFADGKRLHLRIRDSKTRSTVADDVAGNITDRAEGAVICWYLVVPA